MGQNLRKRICRCGHRNTGNGFSADPPRFMARPPHGYHDVAKLREELAMAGFAQVSIETRGDISKAPSPRDAAIPLPGHAAAKRNRGPRSIRPGSRDASLRESAGAAIWRRSGARAHPGPRDHRDPLIGLPDAHLRYACETGAKRWLYRDPLSIRRKIMGIAVTLIVLMAVTAVLSMVSGHTGRRAS